MTVTEAIARYRAALHEVLPYNELEASLRIIFEDVLHMTPVDMVLRADMDVAEFFPARLDEIIARQQRHEPLQYILGQTRFAGLTLRVTPDVLIPRPETERLVDLIVDRHGHQTDLAVLDACTGSGCIAIALARALRFARVDGFDLSDKALAVARDNVNRLRVDVDLWQADLLRMVPEASPCYNIVVSNPPYVCVSERASMDANVTGYEPSTALFVPDEDPLKYYRPLCAYAVSALMPKGCLYLEVNSRFARDVAQLATASGLDDAQVLNDQYGHPRYVIANQRS